METSKNTVKQIAGVFLGAVIGTTLGILFAPEKGTKTRSRLSTRAKFMNKTIKSKFKRDVDLIQEDAEEIKDIVIEDIDKLTNKKKKK
ncbi:MAG: YtxH domain-containing protein [Paludibacter sp.]|nr:YtxH domain-containing protein [Paludibacter sp.]